jgi:SNF2 family DNA or RNA helicase
MNEYLTKIREIRDLNKPINLKPSPYLRSTYIDDSGESYPVELRNYQQHDIMNMLVSEKIINALDTGLGKTLETLATISYVWIKEPEFIPIILTKKSALYQWDLEARKFMHDMECVTIEGEPYERHKQYEEFFLNHNPNKHRLLILTYDVLLRDMNESVIRDRSEKPTPNIKKKLTITRKNLKAVQQEYDDQKEVFSAKFGDRIWDVQEYVRLSLHEPPIPRGKPPSWAVEDDLILSRMINLRGQLREAKSQVSEHKDLAEPPKVASGIEKYLNEMRSQHPKIKFMLVMDEMHVLKNHRGKIHGTAATLAEYCSRLYGLTATPVKNRLMEFFSLFRIIEPKLFPKVTHFHNEFCVIKLQSIGGGRKVPIVVGYRNLDEFVRRIEPYYLRRSKYDVAKELPQLVTRELRCELSDEQEELYDLAENGLLETGSSADAETSEILKAMTRVQQAVDSPSLIKNEETGEPYEGPSSKIDAIADLMADELDGIKTIIFSKFEQMISLVEKNLNQNGIKCVRITGKEGAKEREHAKATFQNTKSGVNVVLITTAGSESINLQAAEHIIFIDSPWSFGDYCQIIGRMIRIGSQHVMVVATHLIAEKHSGGRTIDQYVIKTLRGKKILVDKVAGESLKDGLQFASSNEVMNLFQMIRDGQIERSSAQDKMKGIIPVKKPKPAKKPIEQILDTPELQIASIPILDDI